MTALFTGGSEFVRLGDLVVKTADWFKHQFTVVDPAKFNCYMIKGWYHVKSGSGNRGLDLELNNAATAIHGRTNKITVNSTHSQTISGVTSEARIAGGLDNFRTHFCTIIDVVAGRRIKARSIHWVDSDGSTNEPPFGTWYCDYADTTITDLTPISDAEGTDDFDAGELQLYGGVR